MQKKLFISISGTSVDWPVGPKSMIDDDSSRRFTVNVGVGVGTKQRCCFKLLSAAINRLIQHSYLTSPAEKIGLVLSRWHRFWLIQLVQSDPGTFAGIIAHPDPVRPLFDPVWDNLIRLVQDLRKLVLDPVETGLIETLLAADEGMKDIFGQGSMKSSHR